MWLQIGCSYDYLKFFLHFSKSRRGQLWGKPKNNSLKTVLQGEAVLLYRLTQGSSMEYPHVEGTHCSGFFCVYE